MILKHQTTKQINKNQAQSKGAYSLNQLNIAASNNKANKQKISSLNDIKALWST